MKDSKDEKLALIRELREVCHNNRELYDKVKQLPLKNRVACNTGRHTDKSIVYVSFDVKKMSSEMQEKAVPKVSDPQIIISETFI